jgi:quinol monooxygenase YgiN
MFLQIIQFRTDRRDELLELAGRWSGDATDNGTARSSRLCADRDDPGAWWLVVEFPSYEAAMQNSQRPETDAMSREFAGLCDGEPVFRNLDVLHTAGDVVDA